MGSDGKRRRRRRRVVNGASGRGDERVDRFDHVGKLGILSNQVLDPQFAQVLLGSILVVEVAEDAMVVDERGGLAAAAAAPFR